MQKDCVSQAKQDMETVAGNGTSCHCLPACFSVKYPYGKSMSHLSRVVSDDLQNVSSKYFVKNIAALHFFFYSSKFMSELKSELFGFTEILSNTGGLLSLFLGFSFLSLVELLYFMSLRVGCDIAKIRGKKEKNKEPPVLQFLR